MHVEDSREAVEADGGVDAARRVPLHLQPSVALLHIDKGIATAEIIELTT